MTVRLPVLAATVAWLLPAVAVAQPPEPPSQEASAAREADAEAAPSFIPAPPTPAPAVVSTDEEPSDADLIRWASREIGRADGREVGGRPPIPPDRYLARSRAGRSDVTLPDDTGRDLLRLLAEIGLGALGVGVVGGAALLAVWGVSESGAGPGWEMTAALGGAAVTAVALTGAVTLGADLAGGRGNFGHAFLGQLLGSAAALPLVVLALDNDALPVALVTAGVLPLAGAVLGYEIGHAEAQGGTRQPPVVAYAAPLRGGALGGVAGALP